MWLIGTAFLLHIILLMSVFDIYFKTPITYVNENYASLATPPAKRLVLYVADGLRAQSLYNYSSLHSQPIRNDVTAKYLKKIIDNGYAWGIANTQVPTESRPGHVAMLAGFFEDPSAIMKGWKENPVDFDSVLNQTSESWCWGSPDIITIFSKGENHIHLFMYSDKETQFSTTKDTYKLDTWVFNRVESFFKKAESDTVLRQKLFKEKIIFFLHLLGSDTTGHSYKPDSWQLRKNIRVVDEGIKHITEVIETFYKNDGKTSFLLTSDHGMTDWGSHGSGDPTETNCPIIAWGAGISKESMHNFKPDINQIDIAVLMSTLIGVPIPMNSLGVLPDKFLNLNNKDIALAFQANVKQIVAHYKQKRKESEKLRWLKSYKPLTNDNLKYKLSQIQDFLDLDAFDDAIVLSKILISLAKTGIKFYQTFYQTPILITIALSIYLWIIILFENLLREMINNASEKYNVSAKIMEKYRKTSRYMYIVLVTITCSCCFIKLCRLPVMCYLYFILPQCLLFVIYLKRNTWKNGWKILKDYDISGFKTMFYNIVFYIIALELLIQVFFYRWILSLLVIAVSCWTFVSLKNVFTTNVLCSWVVSTIVSAIFPLLTVVGKHSNSFVFALGGILWLILAAIIIFYVLNNEFIILGVCQISLLFVAIVITFLVRYFGIPQGVQTEIHVITWSITGISILLPFFGGNNIMNRLGHVVIGVTTPFIFLSVSYEPIFLLTLTVHLFTWLIIEHRANFYNFKGHILSGIDNTLQSKSFDTSFNTHLKNPLRSLNMHDFRRAFCYLFYLLFSFFGIGNVASINSFDPMWVMCFVSVFSPFLMTFLILCKTIFIFIIVTANFRAINIVVDGTFKNVLYIILIYCDFMIIHFLCFVKNEGSWLDIGLSISHFVIIETTALFILMLYVCVYFYTKYSFVARKDFRSS